MLYYLVLFCLLLYIYTLGLSKRFQVALYCGLLAIFAAFRFNAGYDYPVYYHFMREGGFDWIEPFSWLLLYVGQHSDPLMFFMLSTALVLGFYYAAFDNYCRRHGWDPIGIFAFVGLPIAYLDSFGVIRQFISIAIFVYVVSDVRRNKLVSLGWLLIAILFHGAAALFLPFVIFKGWFAKARPLWLYLLLWGFFIVVGPSLIKFISLKTGVYSYYFDMNLTSSGRKIYVLLSVMLVYFLINRKLIFSSNGGAYIFNCYFVGMLLFSAALPFGIHISRAGWGLLAVHPLLFGIVLSQKSFLERVAFVGACFFIMCTVIFMSSRNVERDFLNQYQFSPLLDRFQRDLIINKSLQDEIKRLD